LLERKRTLRSILQFLDDYDYFLIITDTGYLNARDLRAKLNHISISFDIYMGRKLENVEENDRSYCDINAGIILSSSVIKKIRTNLDWCVRNAVTNFHSLNIGKCIKYSTKIDECQPRWQGIDITSYKMHSFKLYRDLHSLTEESSFNNASIVYPLSSPNDFYMLHAYFSRVRRKSVFNKFGKKKLYFFFAVTT
jgi:chondroitin polymerizing factor